MILLADEIEVILSPDFYMSMIGKFIGSNVLQMCGPHKWNPLFGPNPVFFFTVDLLNNKRQNTNT